MTRSVHVLCFSAVARGALLLALSMISLVAVAQNVNGGFDPNANNIVEALAVQPDGKIIVGGAFTTLAPNGGAAVTRYRLARLNADGSLDTSFAATDVGNTIKAIAVQTNGQFVIAGSFTQVGAYARNRIARLNADGSVDTTFNPNANGIVYALTLQPNGQLVVGGAFTSLAPNGGASVTRIYIARLNADGSLDTTFDPDANGTVLALALQPDGKLVVSGYFTSLAPNGGAAVTRN